MAKASTDRNTIDLFGKAPGRPRTSTLNRKDQLKLNKRAQRQKEKKLGLKRLELVIEQEAINTLDQLCEMSGLKRSEWLLQQIENGAKQLKKRSIKSPK